MPIPLPNIDTRRWTDLVEEGRSLLPRNAPGWTDYNLHDPGITLLELLAWLTEMDVYRTNRVPPRHIRKFLGLLGFTPAPPSPAIVALTLTGTGAVDGGTEFSTDAGIAFRTLRDITLNAAILAAVQVDRGDGLVRDQTAKLDAEIPVEILGREPKAGAAAYFGFTQLTAALPLSLYFTLAERGGGTAELVWEAYTGGQQPWTTLQAAYDDTQFLTVNGEVELVLPAALVQIALGDVPTAFFYLRCRVVSAQYDATPLLARVAPDTTAAEQAVPARQTFPIAAGAPPANPPSPGDVVRFDATFDAKGVIQSLVFLNPAAPDHPDVRVRAYQPPDVNTEGSIEMDIVRVAPGADRLPIAPLQQSSLHLYIDENGMWQEWTRREDLDSSQRTDFHFVVNAASGELVIGDGERGRTVPTDAETLAAYRTTFAGKGNVDAGRVNNSSLAGIGVTNLEPASRGADAEDLEGTASRAAAVLYCHDPHSKHVPTRGVNLQDYERLALGVPDTRVARAKAYANHDSRYGCLDATGVVTIVIIPDMKTARPEPSAHLIHRVWCYIDCRRTICTQVRVTGPQYLEVRVKASVTLSSDQNPASVRSRIIAALDAFLNPLTGGPNGAGWPFGRDVYRTEILTVIATVPGVDHVDSLSLLAAGNKEGSCGNIAVCAGWLVTSGAHQITLTTGG